MTWIAQGNAICNHNLGIYTIMATGNAYPNVLKITSHR